MKHLIDTNIISEVRKGPRCDRHVATWFESLADADIYLSVLVVGEIRKASNGLGRTILHKRAPWKFGSQL